MKLPSENINPPTSEHIRKKYKKFIVFQSDDYYPAGGLGDITGSFDTIEECREHIQNNLMDSNEVVDRDTWEVIE